MLERLIRELLSARRGSGIRRARALYEAGRDTAAERACEALIARGQSLADAHFLKGLIARRAGRAHEAIAALRLAVEHAPRAPACVLMLGELLFWEEGPAAALACFERGVALAEGGPMHADALADLGRTLAALARGDEARRTFSRALEIAPDHLGALRAFADLLHQESDAEAARSVAARGIASSGDTAARLRRALMLPAIAASNDEIHQVRERFEREMDELLAERIETLPDPESSVGMTAFYLAYHGLDERRLMEKLGRVLRKCYAGASAAPRFDARRRGRRRRVAFVSAHFNTHSIGRTTIGWIRDLPRADFEVWVFAVAPRPGDPLAASIARAADHYVALPPRLDIARAAIAQSEPEFLVFADLGMHPLTYYLAYWRLAPVQLVAWGHPVTSGIDSVDHFISSETLEPPGSESEYSERLLRLKGYFMPRYARPCAPPGAPDRAALGLPAHAHLYGCPQTLFKLHPDFDAVFAAILERDPAARIVLIEARRAWAQRLLARLAPRLGESLARVVLLPQQRTPTGLNLVSCMDVLLDPVHFGGNNSSVEGLALGVPVVTLPAPRLRGRFTLGHYLELGEMGCVAQSAQAYIDLALRLGTDAEARREASERILAGCDRLFDRPDAGPALGEALLALPGARD
ncbi:MAG: tetratricopeptide repeat protein [Burkholderiales bacterium]|nr:tetratricopeptide repeat protein [Burkholderiales bacterium]